MRRIDMETWPRRHHFATYQDMDYPHFNLTAKVEISRLHDAVREVGWSFSVAVTYILAKAANDLPSFRLRIRGQEVVEHDVVHPSTTVLAKDDLFSYCTVEWADEFSIFHNRSVDRIASVKENPTLEDEPGQDNLLFMKGIPWVAFTGLMHPIHMHPADSVPRLAWGKFTQSGGKKWLPLSVQVHHALMDGLHVGRYYERVQELLDRSNVLTGG